eukprot:1592941-Rhodomonas_salina.1
MAEKESRETNVRHDGSKAFLLQFLDVLKCGQLAFNWQHDRMCQHGIGHSGCGGRSESEPVSCCALA